MTKLTRPGRYLGAGFITTALILFDKCFDTVDIARLLKCEEYEAARAVRIAREARMAKRNDERKEVRA